MAFDKDAYERDFIKPLGGKTKLPDDLTARYGITPQMFDGDIATHLREIRAYWNKGAAKSTRVGFICRLCKAADEELQQQPSDMATKVFWDEQRKERASQEQGAVASIADQLKRDFGAFGVVTVPTLDSLADVFSATAVQMRDAAKQAGLDVRNPAVLPTTCPIALAQYNSLHEALSLAGAPSIVGLLHPTASGYMLLGGFRSPDGSLRLDRGAVLKLKDETERRGVSPKNNAAKQAVGILLNAVDSGVDLAQIELYRALQSLGTHRGAPLSARVRLLTESGLEPGEAAYVAQSLSEEVEDEVERIKDMLEAGQLRAARRLLVTLADADLNVAQPLVEGAEQRVAKLRTDAATAVRGGDEARAISLLEEAVSLATDDDELGGELLRMPPPPPEQIKLAVQGDQVTVYWAAGQRHVKDTRYVVRRKPSAPLDFRDGDKVHEGTGTSVRDESTPVARQTFYSVFALSEAGVASRPVTASTVVLPPPFDVATEVGADWVSVTWQDHPTAESVRAFRVADSRHVDLSPSGNSIRLRSLVEAEPVTISLVARYRDAHGALVESEPVTSVLTPRGAARPIMTLDLANLESHAGCRVRVGWQPVDRSEVTIRHSESPAPWEAGAVVTPAQMASHGIEASGSLVTQGLRVGFETIVPEGILHFTPFSTGGTGIVVGRSRSIGTSAPVSNLTVTRFDGFVNVTWTWPSLARVAQVTTTSGGVANTQVISKDEHQTRGCRVPATTAAVDIEVRAAVPVDDDLSLSGPVRVHLDGEAPRVSYAVSFRRRGGGRLTLRALETPTQVGVVLVAQPGRAIPFSPEQGTSLLTESVALEPRREHTVEFELPSWLRKPFCVKAFVVSGSASLQDPSYSDLKVD